MSEPSICKKIRKWLKYIKLKTKIMICYKDKSFCLASKECKKGQDCDRAYTKKVIEDAEKWWGSSEAPISLKSKFDCFKSKE